MKTAAFTKAYNGRVVLNMPETELERGKITYVIGANGSGKSTLARVLAGIEPADSKVRPLSGLSVGYMPQKSFAFRMSTAKNIALNGKDPERMKLLTDSLHLHSLSRQRAKKLSGGETAKMALARLLMGQYELLILDEPTAGLDPQGVSDIMKLLGDLRDALGITIILATHDMDIVPLYCDRVYLLSEGRMIREGTPEELFAAPEALRENHLRLPRIAHLMEILADCDGVEIDRSAATISAARREILRLLQEETRS